MPSRSRLSLVISLRRVPLFYERQIPRRRLPPTSNWMAPLDGFWQSSKTILSFVRMRTSCGFKMSLQERKTESPSRGSATTMFFRSTTLTSDNFRIAFGQTWRVSKETKPTLLQARVLVKFQKWIFPLQTRTPARNQHRQGSGAGEPNPEGAVMRPNDCWTSRKRKVPG